MIHRYIAFGGHGLPDFRVTATAQQIRFGWGLASVCHRGRFPVMITSHKDHGPGQTAGKYAQHRQVSLSQHFTSHLILLRPVLYVVKEWSLWSVEGASSEKALSRMALAVQG